jgi:hypothetical protein
MRPGLAVTWEYHWHLRGGKAVEGQQRLVAVLGERTAQHARSDAPDGRVLCHQRIAGEQHAVFLENESGAAQCMTRDVNGSGATWDVEQLIVFEGRDVADRLQFEGAVPQEMVWAEQRARSIPQIWQQITRRLQQATDWRRRGEDRCVERVDPDARARDMSETLSQPGMVGVSMRDKDGADVSE